MNQYNNKEELIKNIRESYNKKLIKESNRHAITNMIKTKADELVQEELLNNKVSVYNQDHYNPKYMDIIMYKSTNIIKDYSKLIYFNLKKGFNFALLNLYILKNKIDKTYIILKLNKNYLDCLERNKEKKKLTYVRRIKMNLSNQSKKLKLYCNYIKFKLGYKSSFIHEFDINNNISYNNNSTKNKPKGNIYNLKNKIYDYFNNKKIAFKSKLLKENSLIYKIFYETIDNKKSKLEIKENNNNIKNASNNINENLNKSKKDVAVSTVSIIKSNIEDNSLNTNIKQNVYFDTSAPTSNNHRYKLLLKIYEEEALVKNINYLLQKRRFLNFVRLVFSIAPTWILNNKKAKIDCNPSLNSIFYKTYIVLFSKLTKYNIIAILSLGLYVYTKYNYSRNDKYTSLDNKYKYSEELDKIIYFNKSSEFSNIKDLENKIIFEVRNNINNIDLFQNKLTLENFNSLKSYYNYYTMTFNSILLLGPMYFSLKVYQLLYKKKIAINKSNKIKLLFRISLKSIIIFFITYDVIGYSNYFSILLIKKKIADIFYSNQDSLQTYMFYSKYH